MTTEKTLQECTDDELAELRYTIGQDLSALKRQDEQLRAEREAVEAEFERRFTERGSTATKTSKYTVSLRVDDKYPELYDQEAFESYLMQTGRLYLLQKRLSMAAVQEELAAGAAIPGVRVVRKTTINQIKRPQPKSIA
jgi:hypothetical protein